MVLPGRGSVADRALFCGGGDDRPGAESEPDAADLAPVGHDSRWKYMKLACQIVTLGSITKEDMEDAAVSECRPA